MEAEAWIRNAVGGRVEEFYSSIGVTLPRRDGDEASIRCFANPAGHKRDDRDPSCSVNLLTGLWKCFGCGQSGNAYAAALAAGYSEHRSRELARSFGLFLEDLKGEDDKPKLPGDRDVKKWRKRLRESPKVVARLCELKGWTLAGMVRCGLGFDGERVTFPIRDRRLKLVGVVRYRPGGNPKMISVPGSRRDLFPPPDYRDRDRPLFVVEGEPAAVSVWSVGHQAVAVPGVSSWRMEWAGRLANRNVIVLPDCDAQGRDLARRIMESGVRCRVVDLEPGATDGVDVGDWIVQAAREGGFGQMHRVLGRLAA